MKKAIILIMTAALLLNLAGCSLPKTGKNNINKYTYAKDNKEIETVTLSDSSFEKLAKDSRYDYDSKYTIDEMDDIYGLGTIRQTVIEDSGNFIAYSVYDNSKGDRLYVFYDSGCYVDGKYTNGWEVYSILRYDSSTKKWTDNRELKDTVSELDMPEE